MECSTKWASVSVDDVADIATGKSNREDAVPDGQFAFFDRSQQVKRSHRYLFDAEAVIVPGEGKEFVPRYFEGKFDLHQRGYALIPKTCCDGRFLFYAVQNGRDYLARVAVGSTVKSLRRASFETMRISFPPIEVQRRIAHVLSALDVKIEINNRLNGYLAV